MTKKVILGVTFLIGLLYILLPGPSSVDNFSSIPNSVKSKEVGDTTQVSNIAAYFSQFDRKGITAFYKQNYRDHFLFGKIIPPITLNYPPKAAYQYVRDQQVSTFLEEYVYPLRGSIFVNGYEPYIDNDIKNRPHFFVADNIHVYDQYFVSKATLRFYPDNVFVRLFIYLGIWAILIAQFKLFIRIKKEGV